MTRYFFATAADLLPVFFRVESKQEVAYTLMGLFESRPGVQFSRGQDLPTLRLPPEGRATVQCAAYLVTPAGVTINVRDILQSDGRVRYAVDQLANPDSMEINHGGSPESGVLLAGRVATCTGTEPAAVLFRSYANAIARLFTRVKAFWVGPEARELLTAGCRLTQSADSPREYDLVA